MLFENIANGESLKLVVPVATYKVAIVPTGKTKPVILGPVSLTVKGGALNRVYAVGDPEKKTMNVAVHVIADRHEGSSSPRRSTPAPVVRRWATTRLRGAADPVSGRGRRPVAGGGSPR